MFKNLAILLAILAVWSFPFPARAAAESLKVATVNFQDALNQVEQGKKAKSELKKEFEARQKKLDLQQDELKKMQEDLSKQKIVLSEEAFRSKEESFNKKLLDLQKNFASYRQEMAEKEALLTTEIIGNLKTICEEIGKEEGFDLIVENSQNSVVYAQAKEDLTDRVVKAYNKRYKGPLAIK